jgi:perosamine synthetase
MSEARISLSTPLLDGHELKYLQDAIESSWVSSEGPYVTRFEEAVARVAEAQYAVAVVNGTAALHIALLAAGVQPGDEVLVPALTFVATANAVRYCGAHPVFLDVDHAYWALAPERVGAFLTEQAVLAHGIAVNRRTGRTIRAMLPVHLLGHPADMDALGALAERYGLTVVEDACEAIGARYKGRAVGPIGRLGCFSFNGNKVITAGGGGMVVTNDGETARWVRHMTRQAREAGPEYIHDTVGFNYRLTNVCAAVGLAQIERLPEFLGRKREIAGRYRSGFANCQGIRWIEAAPWAESTCWLFTILLGGEDPDRASNLVAFLAEQNIEARRLWRPLHLLPIYQSAQTDRPQIAERLYEAAVSLPSSVHLTEAQQQRVVEAVQAFLARHPETSQA